MVADVILGKELSKDDVFPFLRKCTLLNNIRGRLPYLPMLIGDSFSVDALRGCRAMGIITTRPETLFGRDVAMSIGSLLEVLSSVALAPADRLQNIFRKLSSVEGAAGNLRGALFEMITSHLVGELECGETHIGVLLIDSTNGKQAEADVVLKKQKKIIAYECKGHQPKNKTGLTDVQHWLSNRIPIMHPGLIEKYGPSCTIKFEYWTCGIFDDEAILELEKASREIKRYEISWKDGESIIKYSKNLSATGVRKNLAEHFFKHPTAKLDL